MPSISKDNDGNIVFTTTYLEFTLSTSTATVNKVTPHYPGLPDELAPSDTGQIYFAAYRTTNDSNNLPPRWPQPFTKVDYKPVTKDTGTLTLSDEKGVKVCVHCAAYDTYVRFTVNKDDPINNAVRPDEVMFGQISFAGCKNAYIDPNAVILRTTDTDLELPNPPPGPVDDGMAVGYVGLHPTSFVGTRPDAPASQFLTCFRPGASSILALGLADDLATFPQLKSLLSDEAKPSLDVAILACPAASWLTETGKIERAKDSRLPHPSIDGFWNKLLPENQLDKRQANASYLMITAMDPGDVDRVTTPLTGYADMGGFRYVLLGQDVWLDVTKLDITKAPPTLPVVDKDTVKALANSFVSRQLDLDRGPLPPLRISWPPLRLGLHVEVVPGNYDNDQAIASKEAISAVISVADAVKASRDQLSVARFWYLDALDWITTYEGKLTAAGAPPNWEYGDAARLGEYYRQILCDGGPNEALLQASIYNNYLWHTLSRYTANDFAYIAVKQYMVQVKLVTYNDTYVSGFMPLELGWIGLIAKTGDAYEDSYSSTTVDEIEYQLNQALGRNLPLSIETTIARLNANGFTPEILGLIKLYDEMRVTQCYPGSTQSLGDMFAKLRSTRDDTTSLYHLDEVKDYGAQDGESHYVFKKRVYEVCYCYQKMPVTFRNPFHNSQPLSIKIIPVPNCVSYDNGLALMLPDDICSALTTPTTGVFTTKDKDGVALTKVDAPKDPKWDTFVQFTARNISREPQWLEVRLPTDFIDLRSPFGDREIPLLAPNLSQAKIIAGAIGIGCSDPGALSGISISILLEDDRGYVRDYVVPAAVTQPAQLQPFEVVLPGIAAPVGTISDSKQSVREFDFSKVPWCSLIITGIPIGVDITFCLAAVKALHQPLPAAVTDIVLTINGAAITIPGGVELRSDGPVHDRFYNDLKNKDQEYLVVDETRYIKYDANNNTKPLDNQPAGYDPAFRGLVANGSALLTNEGDVTLIYSGRDAGSQYGADRAVIIVQMEEDSPDFLLRVPPLPIWKTVYRGPDGTEIQVNGQGRVRILPPEQPDGPAPPMLLPIELSPLQRELLSTFASGAATIAFEDSGSHPRERDIVHVLRTMLPDLPESIFFGG